LNIITPSPRSLPKSWGQSPTWQPGTLTMVRTRRGLSRREGPTLTAGGTLQGLSGRGTSPEDSHEGGPQDGKNPPSTLATGRTLRGLEPGEDSHDGKNPPRTPHQRKNPPRTLRTGRTLRGPTKGQWCYGVGSGGVPRLRPPPTQIFRRLLARMGRSTPWGPRGLRPWGPAPPILWGLFWASLWGWLCGPPCFLLTRRAPPSCTPLSCCLGSRSRSASRGPFCAGFCGAHHLHLRL